jgi:hypothetical protein
MVTEVTKDGTQKLPKICKTVDTYRYDHSLESSWGALSDRTVSFSIQFEGTMHFLNFSQKPSVLKSRNHFSMMDVMVRTLPLRICRRLCVPINNLLHSLNGAVFSVLALWRLKVFWENYNKWYNSPKSGRISEIMLPPACLNTFQMSTNVMVFQWSRQITNIFCVEILIFYRLLMT